jgi:hypothetical protein
MVRITFRFPTFRPGSDFKRIEQNQVDDMTYVLKSRLILRTCCSLAVKGILIELAIIVAKCRMGI